MRWRTANNRRKPRWVIHPRTLDYALFVRGKGFISFPYNTGLDKDFKVDQQALWQAYKEGNYL